VVSWTMRRAGVAASRGMSAPSAYWQCDFVCQVLTAATTDLPGSGATSRDLRVCRGFAEESDFRRHPIDGLSLSVLMTYERFNQPELQIVAAIRLTASEECTQV